MFFIIKITACKLHRSKTIYI